MPLADGRRPQIVIFGSSRFHQPWLTEHNLAYALRTRADVLYVEPPVSVFTPFRAHARGRRMTVLKRLVTSRVEDSDGIRLAHPVALPPLSHPRARRISAPWLQRQVDSVLRGIGFDAPYVLTPRPLGSVRPRRARLVVHLVKDWLQSGADLIGHDAEDLRRAEERAWDDADLIVVTSPALKQRLAEGGRSSELVRHGFDASLREVYDRAQPPPAEWGSLPRPWICYAGRIDARLSFEGLTSVAERWSQGSLLLVGPISPRLDRTALDRLLRRSNVHWFDRVSRHDLPARLVHADCLLMPYVDDEWGLYGSPLKFWEYLYAGPPLAGSGYAVLSDFVPMVHFTLSPGGLADSVSGALGEAPGAAERRRRFALENTWDHRVDQLLELLERAS